jgi:DNA-directed RNA polymerase subunit RPC12/RpoP
MKGVDIDSVMQEVNDSCLEGETEFPREDNSPKPKMMHKCQNCNNDVELYIKSLSLCPVCGAKYNLSKLPVIKFLGA